MSRCKSCGAPLLWAVTEHGRRIPLDEKPVAGGNIALAQDASGRFVAFYEEPNPKVVRRVSHFVTCPHAKEHLAR